MTRLTNPNPPWLDGRGAFLDAGYIYLGAVETDPEITANQIAIFWDSARTIPAPQPLRTLAGMVMNGVNPSDVYFAETDYSITTRDADGILVDYKPASTESGTAAWQPLNGDLSTISGQTNTAFGLELLELADAAALQAAADIGTAGLLDKATPAQFRADTSDKVLAADTVWGAATYVALTPGATVAIDMNTGINFTLAMGGNYTLANPTNAKEGQCGKILITQDGTGSRTLAYGVNYKPVGGSALVLSTTANYRDMLFYEVVPGGDILISLAKHF